MAAESSPLDRLRERYAARGCPSPDLVAEVMVERTDIALLIALADAVGRTLAYPYYVSDAVIKAYRALTATAGKDAGERSG